MERAPKTGDLAASLPGFANSKGQSKKMPFPDTALVFDETDISSSTARLSVVAHDASQTPNEIAPVPTSSLTVESRLRGSLLGLAWGDVLGCPVEGYRNFTIRAVYGSPKSDDTPPVDMDCGFAAPRHYARLPGADNSERIAASVSTVLGLRGLKKLRPPGLHSDDTQQAVALLQAVLSHARESSPAVRDDAWHAGLLHRWADLLLRGQACRAWRGIGRNFTAALQRLSRGAAPEQAGSPSDGIGACMKIGPLGALLRGLPLDEFARIVFELSLVTHSSIAAAAFSFAVALAVARFCEGASCAAIRAELPEAVERAESQWLVHMVRSPTPWAVQASDPHACSRHLTRILTFVNATPAAPAHSLRRHISDSAREVFGDGTGIKKFHPNQGPYWLGGVHALAVALMDDAPPSPTTALLEICNLGYDTDTVAAICGSLLGARFGAEWVPTNLLADRDLLLLYAEALAPAFGSAEPVESADSLCRREALWTHLEKESQQQLIHRFKGELAKSGASAVSAAQSSS